MMTQIRAGDGAVVQVAPAGGSGVLLSVITKTGRVSGTGSVILTPQTAAQVATALMHAYQGRLETE